MIFSTFASRSRRKRSATAPENCPLSFVSHQQFTEPVQPRVRSFHLPPPGGLLASTDRLGFLTDLLHVWNIATSADNRRRRFPAVSFIGAQVLPPLAGRLGTPNDDAVERFRQQFHIMPVGSADDKRKRDASPVDQQAAFGPLFFPDPWGCCPPRRARAELCLGCHQCSASPRRSLPDHRIRPGQPATIGEKTPPRATAENDGESPWRCRNFW